VIRGDLDLAWFPWLSVRTGAAELGDAPGDAGAPLVQWQSARVGARLVPLLRGQLIIDRIRLEQPSVHLRRDAAGHGNWEDLLEHLQGNGNSRASSPEIGGLLLEDGTIEYLDSQSGSRKELTDVQLDLGAWKAGAELPIRAQFTFTSQGPSRDAAASGAPLRAQLRLDTRLQTSANLNEFGLETLKVSGTLDGGKIAAPGVPVRLELRKLTARVTPLEIHVGELLGGLADTELHGAAEAEQVTDADSQASAATARLRAHGPLSVKTPSLRRLVTALGIDMPLPRDSSALAPFELRTQWVYSDGTLALKPLDLKLDDTTFAGELTRSPGPAAVWSFTLRGDRIDLGRYVEVEDTSSEPFELPVAALRALPVQGELTFDQARLANAQMKSIRLRFEQAPQATFSNRQ
jgi:AsmA protein